MTFRFQYQARAEPVSTSGENITLDKWYMPIVDPVRMSVAALSLAAIASTTMAIESKIPETPGDIPVAQIMSAIVQHQDPVRPVERVAPYEEFTYASYCYTTIPLGVIRNFTFPNQTIAYIATWKATPNGADGRQLVGAGDNPGTISIIQYACLAGFFDNPDQRIIVRDNFVFTQDVVFSWVVGQTYEFRMHVDLVAKTYTVYIDDTLVATDFSFTSGRTDVNHDHWMLAQSASESMEVCDFRAVADNSQFDIVPSYTQSQPYLVPGRAVDTGEFVFDVVEFIDSSQLEIIPTYTQPLLPLVPGRAVDVGEFVVDPFALLSSENITSDKWTGYQPVIIPRIVPVEPGTFTLIEFAAPFATGGTPGDDIIMAVLPKHEVARVMGTGFAWKLVIQAGGMDDVDNGGNDITNPDIQIIGTTRNVCKTNKLGTFIQFRMVYDDALTVTTDAVIQVFGRFDASEQWQRLKSMDDTPLVDIVLTTSAADVTDGALNYTDPDFQSQTIDLDATLDVIVRVKTALAGTGNVANAFLQAKIIGGIRTF